MRDSVVIDMRYAGYDILDGTPTVERHHIFGGNPNRAKSDADGLWIPLTPANHRGKKSVHMDREMKIMSHMIGQLAWMLSQVTDEEERRELREQFRRRYGECYL